MSTKKIFAVILIVMQITAIIGVLITGSMKEAVFLEWVGFFIFAIIGCLLLYSDNKKKGNLDNASSFENKKKAKNLLDTIGSCIDLADSDIFTCKNVLLERIGKVIATNLDGLSKMPGDISTEETSFRMLSDMTFRLLSTGDYHVYAGTLNLTGKSMLKVYQYSQNWALQHELITKSDFDESIQAILTNIKNVG